MCNQGREYTNVLLDVAFESADLCKKILNETVMENPKMLGLNMKNMVCKSKNPAFAVMKTQTSRQNVATNKTANMKMRFLFVAEIEILSNCSRILICIL